MGFGLAVGGRAFQERVESRLLFGIDAAQFHERAVDRVEASQPGRDGITVAADHGVDAALASGAKVFVLCSTDDTYPELVPQFVKAIKQIDKNALCILAGYPKEQIETHKQSGIDDFIFVGANVVQVINNIFDRTGVEK